MVFKPIPDDTVKLTALRTGNLDLIDDLPPKDLAALKQHGKLRVSEVAGLGYRRIELNTVKPPFDAKALRQAAAGAINREAIHRAVFFGTGAVAQGRAAPGYSPLLGRLWQGTLARVGLALIVLLVACAVLAPVLAPYDPTEQRLEIMLSPPGAGHPLGTDELGRDILSRLLDGARVSLGVGIFAMAISLVAGVGLGLLAGYRGGWADGLIMRVMDGLLAFPALVLALAITAALGPSLRNAMIAIGVVGIPGFARLVRGQVLAVRGQEFVEAARAAGVGDARLIVRHILPNVLAPIIVHASLRVAFAILAEAGLSFLGLGTQPPTPSWGAMLNTGRQYLEMAPWLSVGPGAAIFLTTLSFNFLGDGLRDALDPRLKF